MIVRFVLTRDILRRSTNPGVMEDAKEDFVRGADRSSAGLIAWSNDGARDLKFKGLFLGEKLSNIDKNLLVNFLLEIYKPEVLVGLRNSDYGMLAEEDLSEYTDLQSGRRIPKNKIQFLLEYSQGLMGFVAQAFNYANKLGLLNPGERVTANPCVDTSIETVNGHLVISSHVTKTPILAIVNGEKKIVDYFDLDAISYFHEIKDSPTNKDHGKYLLDRISADSDLAVYLLMGGNFSDLNWAGRNLALGRPAALPFLERLKQGFRYSFTGNAGNTNAWKAFFAVPGSTEHNNTLLDKIWGYSVIGNILSAAKNTVKLCTEYLTFVLKEASRSAFDVCRDGWNKSDKISNPVGRFFAKCVTGLGMVVSGACYYAFKLAHEVIKRVTSPERAAREADKKHKVLGWCSRLFSLGAYVGLAIFAPPVGIPVLGKLLGAKAAASAAVQGLAQAAIVPGPIAVSAGVTVGVGTAAVVVGGSSIKNHVTFKAKEQAGEQATQKVQQVFDSVSKQHQQQVARNAKRDPGLATTSTSSMTASMQSTPATTSTPVEELADGGAYSPTGDPVDKGHRDKRCALPTPPPKPTGSCWSCLFGPPSKPKPKSVISSAAVPLPSRPPTTARVIGSATTPLPSSRPSPSVVKQIK